MVNPPNKKAKKLFEAREEDFVVEEDILKIRDLEEDLIVKQKEKSPPRSKVKEEKVSSKAKRSQSKEQIVLLSLKKKY